MSILRFDYIWNFLRENNRDGDGTTPEDVKCTICRKIMINVHSGVCGCRYCLDCVTNQTKGGANHCPGKKEECKEESLDLDKTVYPDYATDQKIASLIVKCPQDGCNFEAELKNMEQHEKTCQKKKVGCPYCPIGCQEKQLVRDEIKEHLAVAYESHADLLMECLGEFHRKNVSGFKNLTEQMSKMEQELQATKEENESLKSQIEGIRMECSGLVAAKKPWISEKRTAEMQEWREKHHKIKARVVELEQQQLKMEKEMRDKIDGEGEKGRRKGFEWRIDQWAAVAQSIRTAEDAENIAREEGRTQEIFSEAFFSHESGYKMCLSADTEGDYLLGPHDDALAWPFAGTATVSIVNQVTRRNVYQDKIDSDDCPDDLAWQRPVSERNVGMGTSHLVKMEDISGDHSVCPNNRIFIRCHVDLDKKQ